jgi:hypothetical protein
MPQKEGLQAAIDFTKYLLTLSGAAIAFVIQPSFSGSDIELRVLSTFSIILLAVCVISGLAVCSRGCVMLANGNYDLEDIFIKIPGLINMFSFGLGFLFLAYAIWHKIWS